MKKAIGLLALATLLCVAGVSEAAEKARANTGGVKTPDLIGMNVKNSEGEQLGNVEDVVIDIKSGRIAYVVIAHGEVLGFGGKFFAFDSAALQFSDDHKYLLVDASNADLDKAAGFDANKWPSGPDASLLRKKGTADNNRTDATRNSEKDVELRRFSALKRMYVKNEAGENLGQVAGLYLDLQNRKVHYLAMSRGGVAGIGAKYHAVPWGAVQVKSLDKTNTRVFVVDASPADLDKHAGFEWKNWPTDGDSFFKARN